MHIALVVPHLAGGGAERVVLSLASGLIRRGHEVDIVIFSAKIHYAEEVPQEARLFVMENNPDRRTQECAAPLLSRMVRLNVPSQTWDWVRVANALHWDPLCLPNLALARRTRAVALYMERETPDCILPSLPQAKVATLLACRLASSFSTTPYDHQPVVVPIVHNFVKHRRYRYRRRFQHLFAGAAHSVGVSSGVSNSLSETIGVERESITTIYNPVVTPHLQSKMVERPDHPWLQDDGPPVILAAGRLKSQKDYPTLLKAFALVTARRPCRLIILGQGSMRNRLEQLARKRGIADRVSLPGWQGNPYAFMSRASLFVVSSIHEGLSMVLVEAMACGCPVVSTDCPYGPAEILRNGEFGPLVPIGDEVALAEAMHQVLDHPPERQTLQERAADFSLEKAAFEYQALLSNLVCPSDS